MIVSLQDRTNINLEEGLAKSLGRTGARIREGVPDSDAPACSTSFVTTTGGVDTTSPNLTEILPDFPLSLARELLKSIVLEKR